MTKDKFILKNYYISILFIGFVLSLIWIIKIRAVPVSDFDYYNQIAKNVANGGQWGDTYTTVGYSIFLGFFYKIFGANIWVGKILNLFLTLLSNLLMLGILRKVNIKEIDKKIIFALFVLFPSNIFYNSILGTEIFFMTLVYLVIYLYFSEIKCKFLWIGILTAAAAMVKQQFLAFFLVVFLVDILIHKRFMQALKNSLVILITSVILISPWIYRNTKLNGQFTTIANNGGIVLYINNNSQNTEGRWMAASDVENSIVKTPEYEKANLTEKNKMLSAAAKKWIISHPKEFISLGVKRLKNTYLAGEDIGFATYGTGISDTESYKNMELYKKIKKVLFYPAILYILGYSLVILKNIFTKTTEKLDKYKVLLVIYFHMFNAIYFITEGQSRYSFVLTFVFIYFFYFFIKDILCKVSSMVRRIL